VAGNTIAQARQDVRDALASSFTQDAIEGSVPDATSLRRVNGAVYPYIIYRFPDVLPTSDRSLVGPWGDGYLQPVFFLGVGPDMDTAQKLYMKLLTTFLGFQPRESSPMVKRAGGGTFEIGVENGATEAWVSAINFSFTTSIRTLP
jgi:hypothetical protein